MRASNYPRSLPVITGRGQITVEILSGQLIFQRFMAAEALQMKATTVWERIKRLEAMGNIAIKSDTHYSLITILKWEDYQGNHSKPDTHPTPIRHPNFN